MKIVSFLLLILLSVFVLANDQGEQKQVFGDYEVHYMALNSNFLKPDVAEVYGIARSRALGYLSVSILKNNKQQRTGTAVTGDVKGQLRNLIGQSKNLEFKEIKESNAVYYISTFRFDDGDMYNLILNVTPDNQSKTFDVKFSQRFYQE